MPGLLSYGLNSGSQKNGVGCQSYGACKKVFTELLSDAGLLLKYSIDSDQVLFESLFEELNRRRVTVGADSIALIGEWDSFYARSLPLTFSAAACRYITDEKVAKALQAVHTKQYREAWPCLPPPSPCLCRPP